MNNKGYLQPTTATLRTAAALSLFAVFRRLQTLEEENAQLKSRLRSLEEGSHLGNVMMVAAVETGGGGDCINGKMSSGLGIYF